MKEGLVRRVRNGLDINIWEAPWVIDENRKYISSPRRDDITLVYQLIYPHNMEWHFDVVDEVFNDHDKKCILYSRNFFKPFIS